MNRGLLLVVGYASSVAVASSQVSQPDFRLQVVPEIVYKVDDPGGARTSSFVFNTAVICSTDCELTPIAARVDSPFPFVARALLGRTGSRTAATAAFGMLLP